MMFKENANNMKVVNLADLLGGCNCYFPALRFSIVFAAYSACASEIIPSSSTQSMHSHCHTLHVCQ